VRDRTRRAEYGAAREAAVMITPSGRRPDLPRPSSSALAWGRFAGLFDELRDLEARIGALDTRLVAICRENAASRRLAALPGIGPIIATALLASIDDGRHFRSGRELAAWIGLVPRQHTTGVAEVRRDR